jgi:hypothetical protein
MGFHMVRQLAYLMITGALMLPGVGCSWMQNNLGMRPKPTGTGALPPVQAEQLVGYLNERASRLESITYYHVSLRAFEKGIPTPALTGTMGCAQPRNFRLIAKGGLAGDLDLGSNSDQFWAYVKATGSPLFIYASYADFESGRAQLPAGMPFEPDWVMQVVGMTTLPPGQNYSVATNDRERTYTLSWSARTPQGMDVKKEIIFEGDAATATRPQVRKHLVKDAKTGKVICTADVKRAQTTQLGTGVMQYPTQVSLRWEEQKFEMDLSLSEAKLNEPQSAEMSARRFQMPRNLGTNPINLAEYRFGPK